ncbi:MAG TPA: hypothetical protein ACFYD0_11140, partial [Candidatus Wunengus sp. YC65]
MHFRWKIYMGVSSLALLGVSGCYTPPSPKPLTTVKPPESTMPTAKLRKKAEPYIASQLDHYFVRDWRYIVVHHSATSSGNAAEFDKYHRRKKGWENGLGYHFVIGNGNGTPDGKIEI